LFVAGRFFCFFFRHDLSGLGRRGGGEDVVVRNR
jgi:hypothetical protein